jgi:hypothetical protein
MLQVYMGSSKSHKGDGKDNPESRVGKDLLDVHGRGVTLI